MDEDSKKVLYKQLVEMYENNNNKDEQPIIAENEYLQLLAKDALVYILNYRENADFGLDDNGQKNIFYIELPDMDLSGEDLSHLRIKEFIPGTFDEYGMLTASYIDLQDTNALVDLNDIGYTRSEENETGVTDYIIDFELMNFNGCDIYGILPDEYAEYEDDPKSKLKSKIITQNKEGHLDERYLQRRKEEHLSKEEKARSDKTYKRIMSGNSVKGMRGVNDGTINLNDYDFSELSDEQIEALKLSVENYNIETNDIELIDNVNYFRYLSNSEKEKILEHALKFGNMDFLKKHSTYLDFDSGEIVDKILEKALELDEMDLVENLYRNFHTYKRVEALEKAIKLDKMEFVEKYFGDLGSDSKEKILAIALELDKMEFVEEYFEDLSSDLKVAILIQKLEQNDIEYVEKHLEDVGSYVSEKILEKALELDKMEFVEKHFRYLGSDSQVAILIPKLEQNDIKYVEEHFKHSNYGTIEEILKIALELDKMEFVEKHFRYLRWDLQVGILIPKLEQNDIEYVEKHLKDLHTTSMEIIVKKGLELDKIDFVEKCFEESSFYSEEEIVKKALELNKLSFVARHFENLKSDLTKIRINNKLVEEFLKQEINLSKQEIEQLEKLFLSYGHLLFETSFENLIIKKEILSAVNCKKEGFTRCARILFLKPEVMYARLKFFVENGIIIEADKLEETMGCTNKEFEKKYAKQSISIMHQKLNELKNNSEEYEKYVTELRKLNSTQALKKILLDTYPMPRKKEELKVELDKISEKYKGRESD